MQKPPTSPLPRRHWLATLAAAGSALIGTAHAAAPAPASGRPKASPAVAAAAAAAEGVPHKMVYQLNQADEAYQEAIFNSISALLKKYVDDVAIAVVVWGPGIHLLAKKPKRPVSQLHQQRVRSMAEAYGVRFIACGNTMHTVGWDKADMFDFAEIEEVGAAAVMELQEQGYAYLAW